mmetsp:Transcript_25157/g.22294  ORF Transcript_25157/g.22294 Transcript_25157/m.22294 type:complete len:90 (-) Transcript_25157:380-649(-)
MEKYPRREWKWPHSKLTKRQREEHRRKMLYKLPPGNKLDRQMESSKSAKLNLELDHYNDIFKVITKIKNLMDYENEAKNQKDKLETEEK